MPNDTALHKAAHNGDFAKVQLILEEGECDVNEPGASERRALHRAAGSNQVQICELLVVSGAKIEQTDLAFRTALHWACMNGSNDVVPFLISKESSILAQTDAGSTPLHLAVEGGHVKIASMLIDKAKESGKVELIFTTKDGEGKTPFDRGVDTKSKAILQLLQGAGDPNAEGSKACVVM